MSLLQHLNVLLEGFHEDVWPHVENISDFKDVVF